MEHLTEYIPIGLMIVFIGGLISVNKEITKRPTYKETEDKFTEKKLCDAIHKSTDDKIACIPDIKNIVARLETKVDILLDNGYKNKS